jgi:adenylosuccinate synthase
VFDFHQIVDGLKEVELGGSRYVCLYLVSYCCFSIIELTLYSIGTTKKGIGPAYSGKASRSGLRVHHLFDHDNFAKKFKKLVEGRFKRYGHFEYDTEGEILRYQVVLIQLVLSLVHPDLTTHLHTGTGRATETLRH